MQPPRSTIAALLALLLALVGCQGTAQTPGAASADSTQASTYLEFRASFCASWLDLTEAVGNPDAGTPSELTAALDDALARGDLQAADRLAGTIIARLEVGRKHARHAAGWPPGAIAVEPMDPLFRAFETMITAKLDAARRGAGDPMAAAQAAFERAGGVDAWFDILKTMSSEAMMRPIAAARPPGLDPQCPGVPVSI